MGIRIKIYQKDIKAIYERNIVIYYQYLSIYLLLLYHATENLHNLFFKFFFVRTNFGLC